MAQHNRGATGLISRKRLIDLPKWLESISYNCDNRAEHALIDELILMRSKLVAPLSKPQQLVVTILVYDLMVA